MRFSVSKHKTKGLYTSYDSLMSKHNTEESI